MAVITREKLNSRISTLTSGSVDPSLHIREVKDFIKIVSRLDAPMLELLGSAKTHDKVEIEFGEGDIVPRQTTLNEVLDTTETQIDVVTNGALIMQQWDVIAIDDERILLTEKPTNASQLSNVVRGFGASVEATHADQSVIRVIGPAVPEGADAPLSPTRSGDVYKNFMQILEYSFKLTHRAKVTKTYEFMNDQFKAQLERHMKQATLDLGAMALLGTVNEGTGSETNPSSTGGVLEFTTVNSLDLNTGTAEQLTLGDVISQMQIQYKDVGKSAMGRSLMGSAQTKRIWDSFFATSQRMYKETADIAKGDWDTYHSSFGPVTYSINYDMPDDVLLLWNPKECDRLFYENGGSWSTGVYATAGWYEHGFLRADVGFRWPNPRARSKIIQFDTDLNNYENVDLVS